tara:strand:+ start:442 stop:1680 length:1239 start_codon:yes stop_codon:yes gene_type:complete
MEIEKAHDLGIDFEEQVIAVILTDPKFFLKFQSIITAGAFVVENHQCLIEEIGKYVGTYSKVPSGEVLVDAVRRSTWRDKGGMIEIIRNVSPVEDVEYVQDRILGWAKWNSIDQVLNDLEGKEPKEFAQEITKASHIGDDLIMKHTNLQVDDDEGIRGEIIKTPWKWLNKQLKGGPELGDLGVILTVINGGKTTALVNIAYHALSLGKFVVYFTFEDGEKKIKRRLLQNITNSTIEEMLRSPTYTKRCRSKFLKETGSRCEIKDLQSRRTSVEEATGFVRSLEESVGRKVDVVITDYADRFAPVNRYNEPRHALREIFEDCKWLARNLQVVHWTARQVNKSRVGKDILSAEHVAEAWGTMESPDLVIGFGRTLEDERIGRITLYTSKVRDGENHQRTTLLADFARQTIYEME